MQDIASTLVSIWISSRLDYLNSSLHGVPVWTIISTEHLESCSQNDDAIFLSSPSFASAVIALVSNTVAPWGHGAVVPTVSVGALAAT